MKTIGGRLKKLREDKNYTSKDFSVLVDINQTTYSKLENNRKSISVDELRRICKVHKVSADFVLGVKDDSMNAIQYMRKNKNMSKDDISEVGMILEMIDEAENLHRMKQRY